MILNIRYKRKVSKNLPFYFSAALLTLIAILLYLLTSGGVSGEAKYLSEFYSNTNREDGQFITDSEIGSGEIESLEKKYDVDIEKQRYVNYDSEEDYTVRIFEPSKKINKYLVTKGTDLSDDNDILLSENFAKARGFEIGETVSISGISYTISGYLARPDYLFMLENLTDNFYVAEDFGIAIVTEEAFAKYTDKDINEYYSVVYHSDNEVDFRKAVNNEYTTAKYVRASANARISTPDFTVDQLRMISTFIMPLMIAFIVIMLAVVLGRKVKNEQKIIGTLSALGYRRRELAIHYSIFGFLPGIAGSALGIAIAIPCVQVVAPLLFMKIEPLPVNYNSEPLKIIISLLIPAAVYGLFAMLTAIIVMRNRVITMIRGGNENAHSNKMRLEHSKMHFRTKFRLRSILGHLTRTLVVIFGISVGGMVLVYSYASLDSLERYVDVSVDEVGDYEYEYFLNHLQTGELKEGAEVIANTFEAEGYDDSFILMGMTDNPYLKLKDQADNPIRMDDKYYISSMGAMVYHINAGDEFEFYDVNTMKEYKVVIEDIVVNNSQSIIYTSLNNACKLFGLPENSYNTVMSDKKLNYLDSELFNTITKASLRDQIKTVYDSMASVVWMLLAFGIIICCISVYLMVNILLTENTTTVSMLKVLGYHNKEINKVVTHIYHLLIPVGIILGMAAGYALCKFNFDHSAASNHTYIEAYMSVISMIKYILLVVGSYILSLLFLGRKVKDVNMTESLKDNRE
jgi:putative ABC transport system permease protein